MNPAAPDLVIFDMDDVLCRYDLGKWLRVLSSFSGRSPRRLLARLGAEPQRCLFIDDKRSNVEGAVIGGLRGHHFTSGQAPEREARSLGLVDQGRQ